MLRQLVADAFALSAVAALVLVRPHWRAQLIVAGAIVLCNLCILSRAFTTADYFVFMTLTTVYFTEFRAVHPARFRPLERLGNTSDYICSESSPIRK